MPPIELPAGTAAYSDRNPPPRQREFLMLLALTISFLGLVFWLLFGWLANALVWWIPPQVEQALGRVVLPAYERQAQASPAQDTLNQLLDRLESHLPAQTRQGRDYQVLYIPDATVNALALPGDRVILYKGLLNEVESENALMMVLGHELGHFAHRDHLRGMGQGLIMQIVLTTLLGDASGLQSLVLTGAASLSQAQFSQRQEREADEVGLDLLQATYGQVAGATDFFARLSRKQGLEPLAILATHPPSQERIARIEQRIKERRYSLGTKSPLPAALRTLDLPSGSSD